MVTLINLNAFSRVLNKLLFWYIAYNFLIVQLDAQPEDAVPLEYLACGMFIWCNRTDEYCDRPTSSCHPCREICSEISERTNTEQETCRKLCPVWLSIEERMLKSVSTLQDCSWSHSTMVVTISGWIVCFLVIIIFSCCKIGSKLRGKICKMSRDVERGVQVDTQVIRVMQQNGSQHATVSPSDDLTRTSPTQSAAPAGSTGHNSLQYYSQESGDPGDGSQTPFTGGCDKQSSQISRMKTQTYCALREENTYNESSNLLQGTSDAHQSDGTVELVTGEAADNPTALNCNIVDGAWMRNESKREMTDTADSAFVDSVPT